MKRPKTHLIEFRDETRTYCGYRLFALPGGKYQAYDRQNPRILRYMRIVYAQSETTCKTCLTKEAKADG